MEINQLQHELLFLISFPYFQTFPQTTNVPSISNLVLINIPQTVLSSHLFALCLSNWIVSRSICAFGVDTSTLLPLSDHCQWTKVKRNSREKSKTTSYTQILILGTWHTEWQNRILIEMQLASTKVIFVINRIRIGNLADKEWQWLHRNQCSPTPTCYKFVTLKKIYFWIYWPDDGPSCSFDSFSLRRMDLWWEVWWEGKNTKRGVWWWCEANREVYAHSASENKQKNEAIEIDFGESWVKKLVDRIRHFSGKKDGRKWWWERRVCIVCVWEERC